MDDVEIVSRVERRRKWTAAEKAALLAEVEAEGGKVKLVARRHGVSESLLYNWRSAWKAAATSLRLPPPIGFVPIGALGEDGAASLSSQPDPERLPSAAAGDRAGRIEIDLPNGARLRLDERVGERALSRILRALKGSL